MNEQELLKKIEELNLENINLKNSPEYKSGKDILKLKDMIKKFQFLTLLRKKLNRKRISKLDAHQELENNFKFENASSERPKIVIYTVVLGGYDKLQEPLLHFENIDYVAFLDDNGYENSQWEIREIPNALKELGNNTLINRYLKFHPNEIFKNENYDYAIYIDGNVRVISDLTSMTYSIKDEVGFSMHNHQFRDCIYNEAEVCKLLGKGNPTKLDEQVARYKKEEFPSHYGMLEGCVIVSNIKSEIATELLDKWWKEFKNSESLRDQIALPYVLWKNKIKIEDVANLGNNVYKNPKIRFNLHI